MAEEINAGSIVQLKSGGPLMTVNWTQNHKGISSAYCEWFVEDKAPWKKDGAGFPFTSLKLIER